MTDSKLDDLFQNNSIAMRTEEEEREIRRYLGSLGNFAHRYPIRKEFWDKMSEISIRGAVLYTFGIDPDAINIELELGEDADISLPINYWDRLRIITSAARAGKITVKEPESNVGANYDENSLLDMEVFKQWSVKQKFTLADRTPTYPQYCSTDKQEQKAKPNLENELSEKERLTLLKIILGMAMDKYRYEPGQRRNAATGGKGGSIANSLSINNLNVDEDTIRKYLKEAESKVHE